MNNAEILKIKIATCEELLSMDAGPVVKVFLTGLIQANYALEATPEAPKPTRTYKARSPKKKQKRNNASWTPERRAAASANMARVSREHWAKRHAETERKAA